MAMSGCPRGGDHEEDEPKIEGNRNVVRCTKCGGILSSGMISQPGDPDSDR